MDIDRCNSIFELFAAFNFTYAILSLPETISDNGYGDTNHNSFADMVDRHLVKPFSSLNLSLRNYEDKIASFKESVSSRKALAEDQGENQAIEKCDYLLVEIDRAEDNIKVCKDLASEKKNEAKSKVDNKFPQISFLIALFCISVLCLSSSEAPHKHFTLFMIDFWLFLTYKQYIMDKEVVDPDIYLKIIRFYVIGMAACMSIHMIIGSSYIQSIPSLKPIHEFINTATQARKFFVLANLIIPFMHFAYFFNKFYKQTSQIKQNSVVQFELVERKLKEVQIELDKIKLT